MSKSNIKSLLLKGKPGKITKHETIYLSRQSKKNSFSGRKLKIAKNV